MKLDRLSKALLREVQYRTKIHDGSIEMTEHGVGEKVCFSPTSCVSYTINDSCGNGHAFVYVQFGVVVHT